MCSEWEEREKHLYYIYYNIIIQTNKVRRQYKQTSNNNWMSECLYFGQICLKLRTATWYNMTDRQGFPVMVTEDENVWCSTLWSLSAHDPEHSQSICTHKYNMFVRRLFLWLGILYLLGRKYDKWYTVDRNMYFSLNPICVPHRKHTRPCEYGCEELCIINRIGLNLFKLMQIYVRTYSACCLCHVAFYINIHNCHCLKTWPGKEKKSHSFCFVKAADEIETFL